MVFMRGDASARQAFSLVELSIVLVILGLLTGGILAGQSLIRAAELRSVNTEYQRYAAAISTFRDKYFALPGDFTKGVDFWTADAACPSVLATATTNVCNGDGNGVLAATAATSNELFGFWEHLARAGLIEGSYNGAPNSATATALIANLGVNVPRARLSQAYWGAGSLGDVLITSTVYYAGNYGNAFFFGGGTAVMTPTGAMKSEEAWNIDTKSDDGRPDQGAVLTLESQGSATAGAGCGNLAASTSALASSSYDLTNSSTTACALIFKTGY